jgi:hypothetical protein
VKKLLFLILILIISLLSFAFEQLPNNFQTRYWLYFSPDGIDSWTNFAINYTSENYFLEKESDINYKLDIEYKSWVDLSDELQQEVLFNNLELSFSNFKIKINENTFKLFPIKTIPELYFFYKDLQGKYLEDIMMIAYNENEEFSLNNIIRNDEFGIGHDATINSNGYDIQLSYSSSTKEKTSEFEVDRSQVDESEEYINSYNYFDVEENDYTWTIFDGATVTTVDFDKEDFVYKEETVEYNSEAYKIDFKLTYNTGSLKGFKTDNKIYFNYNYHFNYEEKSLEVDFIKTNKWIESDQSTITYEKGKEEFFYKSFTDYKKEIDIRYFSDTYYSKPILFNGFIFKPGINLYIKDGFYVDSRPYDHFMKLRYDFKGLSSMKATSTTLSFDTFFYGKDYNINILNGIQFKINNDSEIENAFYLDINNIYRGFENIRPELRAEYFNSKDIKNLTIQPRLFAKYGNFKINIEDYIDYDVIEEEIENTFLINPYYAVDDLEIGMKLFNFKYRNYGMAYYREYLTKTENLNWYVYLEFLKYFYL